MKAHYQRGGLGDRQCKNELETCLQELLAPIRERRATYSQDKGMMLELLRQVANAPTSSRSRRCMK